MHSETSAIVQIIKSSASGFLATNDTGPRHIEAAMAHTRETFECMAKLAWIVIF
jgi:hypothetical protein